MTKQLLYILGILGVNVGVAFAALAFMVFLFQQDPILAAVPVVLVAPAIILQPWFVAFLFVPGGFLLAPFLTTAVTVLVYGWLNRLGMLEKPKVLFPRFKSRKFLAVVGGFVSLAVAVAFARYVDFPSLNQGEPPYVGVSDLNVTDSRYYKCLGSFIDSEWLWQARISKSELARLGEKLDLHPVDRNQVPDVFLSMPPYWWQPRIMNRTKIISTPDFPMDERGPDGLHALATWNPDDKVIHMWIKYNF